MISGNIPLRLTVILAVVLFVFNRGSAQKHDYNWLMGYDSQGNFYDSLCQCGFGITHFDFNQTPKIVSRDSLGLNFNRSNLIMNDRDGNFLFGCNGVRVYNADNHMLQNGDSLGWGPLFSYFNPLLFQLGNSNPQSAICLPRPNQSHLFDLYYIYVDTLPPPDIIVFNKLLHAEIDVSANGGTGKVTKKDELVLSKKIDPTIAMLRHGNGRDWWMCIEHAQNNCRDIMLYDSTGIAKNDSQCLGSNSNIPNASACRFSQDGNLYVTTDASGDVDIFNFDRCSGALSLREQFVIEETRDSFQWWPDGLEFSPNGRFMYICLSQRILQYDLTANPIASSKTVIANYKFPGHHPSNYYWAQLAPDGKIYINGGSSSYYISAIDSPDNKGSACAFRDQSIKMPTYILGLPYNPNYRLGPLSGSACDTLGVSTQDIRAEQEQILKVYPNPASDDVTIDYGFTDWNKGEVQLEISNQLGQTVYTQPLPMYSGFQQLDVSRFAAGIYTANIKRSNVTVAVSKFVKE